MSPFFSESTSSSPSFLSEKLTKLSILNDLNHFLSCIVIQLLFPLTLITESSNMKIFFFFQYRDSDSGTHEFQTGTMPPNYITSTLRDILKDLLYCNVLFHIYIVEQQLHFSLVTWNYSLWQHFSCFLGPLISDQTIKIHLVVLLNFISMTSLLHFLTKSFLPLELRHFSKQKIVKEIAKIYQQYTRGDHDYQYPFDFRLSEKQLHLLEIDSEHNISYNTSL